MCRIYAMSSNKPTNIIYSMKWFRKLSTYHSSGWGIGWINSGNETIVKSPVQAIIDNRFSDAVKQAKAKIILAHLRRATEGNPKYENTHPFTAKIHGTPFIFEHNGTLKNKREIPILSKKPLGETDSERAFCYIASRLEEECETTSIKNTGEFVRQLFTVLSEIFSYTRGAFNFVMCDEDKLFAFRRGRPLFYIIRDPKKNFPKNPLLQELYQDKIFKSEIAAIITSELLHGNEEEDWTEFEENQLILFENGEKVSIWDF